MECDDDRNDPNDDDGRWLMVDSDVPVVMPPQVPPDLLDRNIPTDHHRHCSMDRIGPR